MRGHLHIRQLEDAESGPGTMADWEALVVDAVGNTIDFWHFKRNHGRVWALLYLRGQAMTAAELQETLGLSKGAVSMVTREVEHWGVVHRVRTPGDATWRFVAETDLMAMVRRVIEGREAAFVSRVREDLEDAFALAKAKKDIPSDVIDRVGRVRTLATLVDKALRAFVLTSRLDVAGVASILTEKKTRRNR
jgi:DNA-binding transcriptional regulator GbsR (MarR family)